MCVHTRLAACPADRGNAPNQREVDLYSPNSRLLVRWRTISCASFRLLRSHARCKALHAVTGVAPQSLRPGARRSRTTHARPVPGEWPSSKGCVVQLKCSHFEHEQIGCSHTHRSSRCLAKSQGSKSQYCAEALRRPNGLFFRRLCRPPLHNLDVHGCGVVLRHHELGILEAFRVVSLLAA